MMPHTEAHARTVHCRTGSLEITGYTQCHFFAVHCRTGSLEIRCGCLHRPPPVHCRTGSSETLKFAWLVNKINPLSVHCKDGTERRDPTP